MNRIVWVSMFSLVFVQTCIRPCNAAPASSSDFEISVLVEGEPVIEGAECSFALESVPGIVLKGDWVSKMWMRIDGNIVVFENKRTTEEIISDRDKKQWQETFRSSNSKLMLDLKRISEGEDGAEMKGIIKLQRGKKIREFKVHGGCAA